VTFQGSLRDTRVSRSNAGPGDVRARTGASTDAAMAVKNVEWLTRDFVADSTAQASTFTMVTQGRSSFKRVNFKP